MISDRWFRERNCFDKLRLKVLHSFEHHAPVKVRRGQLKCTHKQQAHIQLLLQVVLLKL